MIAEEQAVDQPIDRSLPPEGFDTPVKPPAPVKLDRSKPPAGFDSVVAAPTRATPPAGFDEVVQAPVQHITPTPGAEISQYNPSLWEQAKTYGRRFLENAPKGLTPGGDPLPGSQLVGHLAELTTAVPAGNGYYRAPNSAELGASAGEAVKDITGARGYGQMAGAVKQYAGTFDHSKYATQEEENAARTESGTKLLGGAMEAATPLFLYGAARAPLAVARGLGIGVAASAAGGKIAEKSGATPKTQEFVKAATFFVPSALGLAGGLASRAVGLETLKTGNMSQGAVGAKAFGGRATGGAVATPDAFTAGVKFGGTPNPDIPGTTVGGKEFSVSIPRPGAPRQPGLNDNPVSPPAPPQPPIDADLMAATTALSKYGQAETMAGRVVRGMPPTPPPPPAPPPPPTPGQQFGPHMTSQHLQGISDAIAAVPEAQRGPVITEAHDNLVKWIGENGGRVTVNGKIQIADTPAKAASIAQQIINDGVDAHDKRMADAQKQADQAAKDAEKPAKAGNAATQALISRTVPQSVPRRNIQLSPIATKIFNVMGKGMTADSPAVQRTLQTAQLAPGQEPVVMVKKEPAAIAAKLAEPATPPKPEDVAKVGTKDPESGREIVQPSNSEVNNQRLAAESAGLLTTELSHLSASVPGAKFARLRPQKAAARLDQKIDGGSPPNTISDYLAAEISADSPAAKDALIAKLKEHGDVVGVDDKFLEGRPDKGGYPSANIQVRMPSGITAEVQVVPSDVQDITDQSHHHYTEGRKAEAAGDTAAKDKHYAEASRINGEALDAFKARNGIKDEIPDIVAQHEAATSSKGIVESAGATHLGDMDGHVWFDDPVTHSSGIAGKVGEVTKEGLEAKLAKMREEHAKSPSSDPRMAATLAALKARGETKAPVPETKADKYETASTQIDIPKDSALGKAHAKAIAAIPDAHLGENGRETGPHVTVKFGLKDDSPEGIAKLKEALSHVAPFEVPIGKTDTFPPGVYSKGDSPVVAKVEANKELLNLRKLVTKSADFEPDTFPDYKPHVTMGYVKPEFADQYKGGSHLEGQTAELNNITISRKDGSKLQIPLGGKVDIPDLVAMHEAKPAQLARGEAGTVPLSDLHFDPKRFQFKLNTDEQGATGLLKGQKFNQDLSGVIQIWQDPENGNIYVVNGHHRVQLAKSTGQESILARHIDVPTEGKAREVGALTNIAEGRGTAVDAAKFFRESGIGMADLAKHGISLGEATAENGLALSRLDPFVFDKVVSGDVAPGRGIAIGKATDDPAVQEAVLKMIDKHERHGKRVTDGTVAELTRFASSAEKTSSQESTLFGTIQRTDSTAIEKAEVSDYIRSQMAKERRLFGSVSTEAKATELGKTGNKINAGENAAVAKQALQHEEAYGTLSSRTGPVNDILDAAAQRLAKGESAQNVKQDAYAAVRKSLREIVAGGQGTGVARGEDRPSAEHTEPAGLFGNVAFQKSPTFYSKAEKVAEAKLPNWTLAEAVKPTLKAGGVKDAEMKWIGLDDWLKGKAKVTKAEVVNFIKENNVQIKEVTKGEHKPADRPELTLADAQANDATRQDNRRNATKFESYVLPGGTKYRELLLTMPDKSAPVDTSKWTVSKEHDGWWRVRDENGKGINASPDSAEKAMEYATKLAKKRQGDSFRSGHFDEPNVLAHIRFNDRVDADGKRTLFIEEIQSDWAQKGRKLGFRSPDDKPQSSDLGTFAGNQVEAAPNYKGVPNMPFKSTWHELAAKRMLRYAADNGYDSLSWTTGEQQAERYDLSKQVDSIRYSQRPGDPRYDLEIRDKNRNVVNLPKDYVTAAELPDIVGKEIAQKIIDGEGKELSSTGYKDLTGLDLKVGGSGMKGFYDKILPDFLNSYGKKWGARVGESEISSRAVHPDMQGYKGGTEPESMPIHSIPITPAMRDSVLSEGQPLFQKGAAGTPTGSGGATYTPNASSDHPIVEVDAAAIAKLRTIMKGDEWDGFALEARNIRTIAAILGKGELQNALMQAQADAKGGTVILLRDTMQGKAKAGALREELFHAAQIETGNGILDNHVRGWESLLDHPVYEKLAPVLRSTGYSEAPDFLILSEIAAKVGSGQPEMFDHITPEQGSDFMVEYFDKIAKTHGTKALETFDDPRILDKRIAETFDAIHDLIASKRTDEQATQTGSSAQLAGGNERNDQPLRADSPREAQASIRGPDTTAPSRAAISKGDTVTLRDGTSGIVKYVNKDMGVSRVQVGDKTSTVRTNSLTPQNIAFSMTKPIEKAIGATAGAVIKGVDKLTKPVQDLIASTDIGKAIAERHDFSMKAKALEKGTTDLDRKHEATAITTMKYLEDAAKATTSADRLLADKFIDSEAVPSSPRVQLTPGAKDVLDNYVDPIRQVDNQHFNELQNIGIPLSYDPGYLHRVAIGKPSQLENATQGGKGTGKGNTLSQRVSADKSRVWYAIEDPNGVRRVVAYKNDSVLSWRGQLPDRDMGTAKDFKPGDTFQDKNGKNWSVTEATKDEIEKETPTRYYRDPLAVVAANHLQLTRAVEAKRFLENWKVDPSFADVAVKPKAGTFAPKGWKGLEEGSPVARIFPGYKFEPRTAEVLQTLSDKMTKENSVGILGKMADFAQTTFLMNPIMHVYNMADFALVSRGIVAAADVTTWPSVAKSAWKGMTDVITRGPNYVAAIDAGANLLSHKPYIADIGEKFVEVMSTAMQQNKSMAAKMVEYLGLTKGDNPVAALRRYSHAVAFGSNDVFYMMRLHEQMADGMNLPDAVKDVNKIFPSYQVPTRVMDVKLLGDIMRTRGLSWFNGYHLGKAAAVRNMSSDAFKPGTDDATRGHAFSQIAALALLATVGYQVVSSFAKRATGEKDANLKAKGLSGMVSDVADAESGKKSWMQVAQSQFTPSSIVKSGMDIISNRDYAGNKVYNPYDSSWQKTKQKVGFMLKENLAPVAQYEQTAADTKPGAGKREALRFGLGLNFSPRNSMTSEAQIMMQNMMRDKVPSMTPEDKELHQKRQERIADRQITYSELKQSVRKERAKEDFKDDALYNFPRLQYHEMKQVIAAATPEEKKILEPLLRQKQVKELMSNPMKARDEGVIDDLRAR